MKKFFFTPGPAELHPVAKAAIAEAVSSDICSISHRSEAFREIYRDAVRGIRSVMQVPGDYEIVFLASATEAMERIIESCVASRSFHLVNGAFSKRFRDISESLGRTPLSFESPEGEGFRADEVEIPEAAEMLCITQNETSTGVWIPPDEIYSLCSRCPDKLIAVDMVSCAPCTPLDLACVDLAFFSVQKAFGLPAGLGVLIASPRSVERAISLNRDREKRGAYHSLPVLVENGRQEQTYETPNVLAIYLLGKVAAAFRDQGVTGLREETLRKASLIYEKASQLPDFEIFVTNERFRSPTVISLTTSVEAKIVRKELLAKGFEVGAGYGKFKDYQIRIANFPAQSEKATRQLVDAL